MPPIDPLPKTKRRARRDLLSRPSVAVCAIFMLAHRTISAADLDVSVLDANGKGVAGVVVVAENAGPLLATDHSVHTAVMDQHNKQFVPNILVVQTGTGIDFPNSDQIEHQVYSFSPAKAFQLSLYAAAALRASSSIIRDW